MENRVNDSIELIKAQTDSGRVGSKPKPPKAVAQSASLEAARHGSDHQTVKQRLTDKTVAQAITLRQRSVVAPYAASCSMVTLSPATVVRRMSRTWLSSKRRTRCIVERLSHITRSYRRHL
jgi:hypothetical protein